MKKIVKTNSEWKQILTPAQYNITREKGTERPFTGKYYDFYEQGTYYCVACKLPLFDSNSKFQSGCGWPSFSSELEKGNIILVADKSHGMLRTEVCCASCNAHLGHVFNDGPPPTGTRYCINSEAISFLPEITKA